MSEIEITNQRGLALPSEAPASEIEKALDICQSLSSYQLVRLESKITSMLADSDRIDRIKSQFSPGDELEYFSPEENRDVKAVLLKHNRTLALVCRADDGMRWKIPYTWIKADETEFQSGSFGAVLTRDDISVDMLVGFKDRQNQDRFGQVVRLNQKTVSINCDDGSNWRVAYCFLFRIIEGGKSSGDQTSHQPRQQLLID